MDELQNPIREYAWGSRSALARLQGRPVPSPAPEAELWVGAHPAAPSRRAVDGAALPDLIAADPGAVLSPPTVSAFGPRLPYLLKLLAADAPLSLQAHPDAPRAAAGYATEEDAGVPRAARHRRYVDPHHKPELLVAVTPFRALCGFRDPAVSAARLAALEVPALAPVVAALRDGDLATAVRAVLTGSAEWGTAGQRTEPESLVDAVVQAAAGREQYGLVAELAGQYPNDAGVVLALLLNEVTLAPGEAIFMPAGNMHAYLGGTGVEIMAASDNVLRGGLTGKHVDVSELLEVLRFEALSDPVVAPVPVDEGVVTWPVPVSEFTLHRVRLTPACVERRLLLTPPRTVLCLAGRVVVDDGATPVTLTPGTAAFGGADGARQLVVRCADGVGEPPTAEVFVASVGSVSAPDHEGRAVVGV